MNAFERYAPVVDVDALATASATALAPVVAPHLRRLDGRALAELLPGAEPLPWTDALRWPSARPGLHWAHAAGLFHVLEEASLLPVALLDVRPGMHVLDLCAAPGGKAARVALALEGRGFLLANDRRPARHRGTSALFRRLGLAVATTAVGDGTRLSGGAFDRVLVDAPCSAEGNRPRQRGPVAPGFRASITAVQQQLLDRAIDACRPGGRVVYATCTYAPEENEAIVEGALRRGDVTLAEVTLPGLATSPGLAAFPPHRFDHRLRHARRLWAHRSGTGGFFAAALDKVGGTVRAAEAPPREEAPGDGAWAAIADRFGFPPLEELGLRLVAQGSSLRLLAPGGPVVLPAPLTPAAMGLAAVRRRGRTAKLTTEAAMRLGRAATRNLVQLDTSQRDAYLARATVALRPEQRVEAARGYVIVRHGPHALGMGVLRGEELASEYPKAWALPQSAGPTAVP